jgi:NAD(P)-dependent dehydrogenase (short-subunit alcohol dehydrogenase family)
MQLKGQSALITGAARGIGLAIATAFVREGANVCGLDVNGDELNRNLANMECPADGGRVETRVGDVTDEAFVAESCKSAREAFGSLNLLVCNAATLTPSLKIEDLDAADWRAALDVNLTSAFYTCKYGIPLIRASGGGSIIIVASQMGSVAWKKSAAYCSTKGALIQLAKALALDHADEGIRVNTLSPGGTLTHRLTTKFGDAQSAEREWGPMHPMGRLGRVEEIADGAVFLASSSSSFMTGADLVLDGGYTAW